MDLHALKSQQHLISSKFMEMQRSPPHTELHTRTLSTPTRFPSRTLLQLDVMNRVRCSHYASTFLFLPPTPLCVRHTCRLNVSLHQQVIALQTRHSRQQAQIGKVGTATSLPHCSACVEAALVFALAHFSCRFKSVATSASDVPMPVCCSVSRSIPNSSRL